MGTADLQFGQAPPATWLVVVVAWESLPGARGNLVRTASSQSKTVEIIVKVTMTNFLDTANACSRWGLDLTIREDAEADNVYDKVDEAMDSRRKRSRLQQLQALEAKRARGGMGERPRIADQFADLKRELSSVSASEWDAIPEVGDHSLKLKQARRKESFVPVPDSIIASTAGGTAGGAGLLQSLDPAVLERTGMMSAFPAGVTAGSASALPRGAAAGGAASAGGQLMERLDRMSDSVTGQTVVDSARLLDELGRTQGF